MRCYRVLINRLEAVAKKHTVSEIIRNMVKRNRCIGYSVDKDYVNVYFSTSGDAMMGFLAFEEYLSHVVVETATAVTIDLNKLKGVMNHG